MKTPLILTMLLLGTLAFAPSGQAEAIEVPTQKCATVYDFPDLGWQVCYDLEDSGCTVYEYRTTIVGTEKECLYPDQEASSAQAVDLSTWPKCFPAAVGQLCFSPYWPGCNLWIVWSAIPAQPTCLVHSDPGPLATTSAAVDPPPCYEVYSQQELAGGYWLVRRNSCSAQLYHCPEGSSPPGPPCEEVGLEMSSAAAPPTVGLPPLYCYDIYSRREVGPVAVVMTSSCSGHVEVCDDRPTIEPVRVDLSCLRDYLPQFYCMPYSRELVAGPVTVEQGGCGSDVEVCNDSVLDGSVSLGCILAPVAASAPEPMCMYYYYEHEVGPVRYVQRDSCHSEAYICDEDAKAYANGQVAKPDPNGFVMCAWESTGLVGPVIW